MEFRTFLKRIKQQAEKLQTAGAAPEDAYTQAVVKTIRLAAEHQDRTSQISEAVNSMGGEMLPAISRDDIGDKTRGVYFVQDTTGAIKIGQAKDVWKRLGSLSSGTPLELRLVGFVPTENLDETEKEMHKRFAAYRFKGEWFWPDDDLEEYITEANA